MKSLLMAAAMVVAAGTGTSTQQQAPAVPTIDSYRVGANDTLAVTVWRREDLTGEFVVPKDGKIKLWGTEIDVLGLELDELRKRLRGELLKQSATPLVVIQVKRINGRTVPLRR